MSSKLLLTPGPTNIPERYLEILKNNRVGYKLSCSVQSFNYTLLNDYRVA